MGRLLSPGPSVTPESHIPAVVTGLKLDRVFRVRSGSGSIGDSRAGESGGEDQGSGEFPPSEDGEITTGEGKEVSKRVGMTSSAVVSIEGRSTGVGKASSLMRRSSALRFPCRSSSLSTRI